MKKFEKLAKTVAIEALAFCLAAAGARAAGVNLATGLDGSGIIQLAGGALDWNWSVTGASNPLQKPNAYVVGANSGDFDKPGNWIPNGPNSSWIAANPNDFQGNGGNNPNNVGGMIFQRTFYLPYQANSYKIADGRWAFDDYGIVILNNHIISSCDMVFDCWRYWHTLSAPTYDFVNGGMNTLTVMTTFSDSHYEGLRLEGAVVANVPEPATWAMMVLGFACLGFAGYRRNRSAALAA